MNTVLSPPRSYPSFEKFPVNHARCVRMPATLFREFRLEIVIDQVRDKNIAPNLPVRILVELHAQPVCSHVSQFSRWILFYRSNDNGATGTFSRLVSLSPEEFPATWSRLAFTAPQKSVL